MLHTPYGRVSVQDSRLFYTRGLRAAGGARKKRRSARLLSEHFVAGDDSPKNATSLFLFLFLFLLKPYGGVPGRLMGFLVEHLVLTWFT